MRFHALLVVSGLVLLAGPAAANNRDEAREQVKFGIEVAQHRLWREAIAKFERAAELDPQYPAAWNNLAIAYEQHGDLEKAMRAYETALKLDDDNQYIRQNYELFREIYDRANRQNRR
jgi:Flp pilus assembly protein TadD